MADPRATPDFPRNEHSPGVLGLSIPVAAAQSPTRHACARSAIRVSAIVFCHNPDTSNALFKEGITDFGREGVWA
jgi:hypothetical protein